MPAQQIQAGSPATLSTFFPDQNGEPREVTGDVTVTVTRADGSSVTHGDVTHDTDTGAYEVALPSSATAQLGVLTLRWTAADDNGAVDQVAEIVGGYLFSVADVRAAEEDLEHYSAEKILRIRKEVEDELWRITGRSFVSRARTAVLSGDGGIYLDLPDVDIRRVTSLGIDGVRQATWASTSSGRLLMSPINSFNARHRDGFPRGVDNVEVSYEYGLDTPPADLKRAAITRLRSRLVGDKSNVPDRATAMSPGDGATYTLWTPGIRGAKTGIPSVDDVYSDYSRLNNPMAKEYTGTVAIR